MSKTNKVHITVRLNPDLADTLNQYCVAHHASRSEVLDRAVRTLIFPEYIEERERILTETLDRFCWEQRRERQMMKRQFQVLKEVLALYVRQFYFYTPPLPETEKKVAVASGRERYNRFLEQVAQNVGTGKSILEQAPELTIVEPEDFPTKQEEVADDDKREADRRP